MGLIGQIFGMGGASKQLGEAVGGVAEVFVGNRAERDAAAAAQIAGAVSQFEGEFASAGALWFDRFVNGLNRLPRPMLALGTLGLFAYAMAEPAGFSTRMQGLGLVPEPLWWLLGAIVSFYFGARELHHQRTRTAVTLARAATAAVKSADPAPAATALAMPLLAPETKPAVAEARAEDPDFNAAVEEWRRLGA